MNNTLTPRRHLTIEQIDQELAHLRKEYRETKLALDRGIILRRAKALKLAKAKLQAIYGKEGE